MSQGGGTVPGSAVDYQRLFRALPTPYLVLTPELVIADANVAYLQMVGLGREDVVGRPASEVFPPPPDALDPDGRHPVQVSAERARDTGRLDPVPLLDDAVRDAATGEMVVRSWSLTSAPVLDDAGRTTLVVQRAEEVADHVRARRPGGREVVDGREEDGRAARVEADLHARLQQLGAVQEARDLAARRLASLGEVAFRLTAAETVEDLERIVVREGLRVLGADGAGVVSPDERGGWRATLSDALGSQAQVAHGAVPYDSPMPGPWVCRTGQRVLLPTRASGLAFHDSMAEVYADIPHGGWAFLPLTVSGETLGCLAVTWAEEHPFAPDELDLLDTFAAQCAQALQRIRATQREREAALAVHRMSEALQRSMLTRPAIPDALQVAVRYQPAAQEAQVGGDWYDAFVTAAGSTLLVVGDVSGHDRTAAATMGQVRNLLRGLAYDSDDSPGVLLTRLDGALRGLQLDDLATAVLARVEQRAADRARGVRRLRWSNAGHPPPLLRQPDGRVDVLDGEHDLLLGLDPDARRRERVAELVPGSTLLLYTDGLVERRGTSLDDTVARLADAFATDGDGDPEEVCDRLLASAAPTGRDDDIAMLVLRLRGQPQEGVATA